MRKVDHRIVHRSRWGSSGDYLNVVVKAQGVDVELELGVDEQFDVLVYREGHFFYVLATLGLDDVPFVSSRKYSLRTFPSVHMDNKGHNFISVRSTINIDLIEEDFYDFLESLRGSMTLRQMQRLTPQKLFWKIVGSCK